VPLPLSIAGEIQAMQPHRAIAALGACGEERKMIELRDKETGAVIGQITEEQFRFLADELEEESETDTDYYINVATIEMFEEDGADPTLVKLLRDAIGSREEMEIQWSRRT
jgi:processive 1,2-diacylglycerol beta-glucosyltransferase